MHTRRKQEFLVLALLVSACGGGTPTDEPGTEATSGAESAASYEGPIASTDQQRGKEVFDDMCSDCHPDGGEDVGPSLIEHPNTPARLRQQVREGSGKMRPFSEKRLSDHDLEAVLAWLASINAVR